MHYISINIFLLIVISARNKKAGAMKLKIFNKPWLYCILDWAGHKIITVFKHDNYPFYSVWTKIKFMCLFYRGGLSVEKKKTPGPTALAVSDDLEGGRSLSEQPLWGPQCLLVKEHRCPVITAQQITLSKDSEDWPETHLWLRKSTAGL